MDLDYVGEILERSIDDARPLRDRSPLKHLGRGDLREIARALVEDLGRAGFELRRVR